MLLCATIALGGENARTVLMYERDGLLAGQWWRVVSGHFTHLGWEHFLLNAAGLILVTVLQPRPQKLADQFLIFVFSPTLISGMLFLFDSELAWYVGLSGVLHCLYLITFADLWKSGDRIGLWLIVVGAAKVLSEQFFGATSGTEAMIGASVVVNAHLYGCCAAVLYLLLSGSLRRFGNERRTEESNKES